jgi:ketosteroid isomerase-like protein
METHAHASGEHERGNHYRRLILMTVLSFIAMYALMYAMVNSTDNVYANFNQFYMAGLMTAAMVIIELALMRAMYHNPRLNAAIFAAAAVALIASWMFIRRQTGISDGQFLRSMIPHHAGAILMCQRAAIDDRDIRQLCENIILGQQAEIDQMKAKLRDPSALRTLADSTEAAAVVQRYHRALADGDSAAALSLLAGDAIVLESGDLETRDEYRSDHLPADIEFARAVPSVQGPTRVVIRGDVAWASSTSTSRGAYRGRAIDSEGAELMVLTRQQDGWKIRAIHWSSHASRP